MDQRDNFPFTCRPDEQFSVAADSIYLVGTSQRNDCMASLTQLMNLKNIRMVFRNISKVGFFTTLQYIFSDLIFDYKYGVETVNTKMLDELEIDSPNKSHGRYYEGTNAYLFKKAFTYIKVD